MALLYWLPDFDTNIAIIDQQHRHLVKLINQLHENLNTGSDRKTLLKILNNIDIYAATHFAREEDLFDTYDYSEIDEHIQEHEYFEDTINQFTKEFKAGKQELTNSVISFLGDWLLKHINGTDQKYATFLRSRGVS